MNRKTYYAHGKLLLTAEYLVLDGAVALALPTKKGQSLEVCRVISKENEQQSHDQRLNPKIYWKSLDNKGNCWYECVFECTESGLQTIKNTATESKKITATLLGILQTAQKLNPAFLTLEYDQQFTTRLEFDRQWGLGTSSTLIAAIAKLAAVDPFILLAESFGGSGYDIACAIHDSPILYTRTESKPLVQEIVFDPPFQEQLFFVYRNQKQDSKASIAHYRSLESLALAKATSEINEITKAIQDCKTIELFEILITKHETIISNAIQTPTVKSALFWDYPRAIKSLGGWGGDFILAIGGAKEQEYFIKKGYTTIVSYQDMIL